VHSMGNRQASELVCGLAKDRNPDLTPLFVQRGLVSGMQVKSGRKSFIASDSHCKNRSRLFDELRALGYVSPPLF